MDALIVWHSVDRASLHFVRVDRGLVPPSHPDDLRQGTLWAIHGGGIYEFTKYKGAPASWPSELHWSKWRHLHLAERMLLLTLVYYLKKPSCISMEILNG